MMMNKKKMVTRTIKKRFSKSSQKNYNQRKRNKIQSAKYFSKRIKPTKKKHKRSLFKKFIAYLVMLLKD